MADGTIAEPTKASLECSLEVSGVSGFEVVTLHVVEGLGERTTAFVEVGSHDDLEWEAALLGAATLAVDEVHTATRTPLKSRRWTMVLGEVKFVEHKDNAFRYRLELHDPLWPLSLGLDTRKFRNKSMRDIVSSILSAAQIPQRWETTQQFPVRKYTAQYRESNLAFVERLLEFEGVFYRFDDDGTVVFVDNSPSAALTRDLPYELIESADGMARADVGLHELRRGARVTTGRVTLGDYNWKKPDVQLRETGWGEDDTTLERFEYAAGFREPVQGTRLAQLRVEAYRATAQFLDGKGNDTAFGPGKAFRCGGLAAAAFAGDYLLVRVEHLARTGAYATGQSDASQGSSYENRFHAIPLDRPFRKIPSTQRPIVAGTHTAMVRGPAGEEIHTDRYGRFRAQLHWDREAKGNDEDSRWMRLTQETASSMVLARTGWEMMVGYVHGDPDRPFGLGRAINGQMTPTYGQPANKNVTSIKTPSSPATGGFNEVKLDDSSGSQLMHWRAEKDYDALIKNDKTEKVGVDETHSVGTDFKRELNQNQFVTIGGNDSATYDSTSELKVKGNRSLTVGGSESVDIGAGMQHTVTKSDSEKVGAVRLSVVGSIKIPDFKAMAKSALKGLNPIDAIKAQLKNPFAGLLGKLQKDAKALESLVKNPKQLIEGPLAKMKGQVDALKKVLNDPKALLESAKKDLTKELQKSGEKILQDAFKKAKEIYKEKGLGESLKGGWGALEEGAKKLLADLPEKGKGALLESLQKSVGSKVKDLMTLGGIVELPKDFKLDGPGGLLPSMDQIQALYGPEGLADAAQSYLQKQVGTKVQDMMKLGGLIDLPKDFKLEGPGGLLPSLEQLKTLYGADAIPNAVQSYIQKSVGGQVTEILKLGGFVELPKDFKLEGAGGLLPSLDQLKQLYSLKSLQSGITAKLDQALNTATGGLYDTLFPKKGQNGQRVFKLGWDEIDKLIDMFTQGGLNKNAETSIKIVVGGASIKAAIGPISWGSKIAWLETIGGLKYTRTPKQIDQDVAKNMIVTVIGKATRNAGKQITIHSDVSSSLTVKGMATYEAGETFEITGKNELAIDVGSQLLLDGAGSTFELTPSSLVIGTKTLTIKSAADVVLGGNVLQVSK
jgi:type VI secretion system secreted protein VgrG